LSNYKDAALSLVSMLPYAGDAIGKGGKLFGKGSKIVANAVEEGGDALRYSDEAAAAVRSGTPPTRPRTRPGSDLPSSGKPNSSAAVDYGSGRGTIRDYGPDGAAKRDYDFGHGHGAGDPHAHDWDWSNPTKPRGPSRPLNPGE
jgi:hypothetical protein